MSSSSSYKGLDSITVSDIEAHGIPSHDAVRIHQKLSEIIANHGPATPQTWQNLTKLVLRPDLPFSFHQAMYYGCYRDFGPDPPAWLPDLESARLTNVGQLLEKRGYNFLGPRYKDPISNFLDFQEFSVLNPEVYWKNILEEMGISFSHPPHHILHENLSHPGGEWLPGAFVNPASNCLSLNRVRNLDDVAILWRDEGEDDMPVKKLTLDELRSEVWLVARALGTLGLTRGSAIAIDMPMNVASVIIYLAIVMAGHVVVSIADSFAPSEIAARLKISKAKAIFTQDSIVRGGKSIPLYSRVIDAQSPRAIVVFARGFHSRMKLRDGDISWDAFRERVRNSKRALGAVLKHQDSGARCKGLHLGGPKARRLQSRVA